eukprot:2497763-Lingulodinium_polyedra.AAC.1
MTLWRGNVRTMYTFIADRANAVTAERLAGCLPGKCIAGRWGSVQESEQRLVAFGRELLRAAFVSLKAHRDQRTPRAARDRGRPELDEDT